MPRFPAATRIVVLLQRGHLLKLASLQAEQKLAETAQLLRMAAYKFHVVELS